MVDGAAGGDARAVGRSRFAPKLKITNGIIWVDLVLPAADDIDSELQAVLAPGVGHVVEPLEGSEVIQLGRVAAGTEATHIAGRKDNLRHSGCGIADIDARQAQLPG